MHPDDPSPPSPPGDPFAATRVVDEGEHTLPGPDATLRGPSGESAGDQIGPYHLLEALGEGGFGTVWLAEQKTPVKRRVALKILKPGMDTREVIARFEAERQALAMMDHPNLARVFDAGATATGRPYFAMERVRGVAIVDYCRIERLDTPARLRLFVQVCQAIQHAHQKGVIHRDIKPSNVLVTMHDDRALVKVIDFGIAKAVNGGLTPTTVYTQVGQMIGTPIYMSPEQAALTGLDIDTRADIYSLGVLLYELLTGTTPFSHKELTSQGYAEMLRIVREVDPPRPSTRLATLRDARAALPESDARRLGTMLRGDLDWITMKCLEKDRTRRYDTANALAMDVLRHLNGEAVVAAPPSQSYRIGKFVRRNRGGVIAAGIIVAALIMGMIGTLWQARRAEAEATRALAAEAEARHRADALEQVAAFQDSQLSGIDPERMGERLRQSVVAAAPEDRRETVLAALAGVNFTDLALSTLDENIFDRALAAIDERFATQPLVAARLLQTLADTLVELGRLDRAAVPQAKALEIRRRELGDQHPDTLTAIAGTGNLHYSQGRLDEAERFYRQALDGRRATLGALHPDTLMSINDFGELLFEQGHRAEAEPYFREALAGRRAVLGNAHLDTLTSINDLGASLTAQGKLAEAEPFYREALDTRRRTLGDAHADTQESLYNMGGLLRALSRFDDALPYYREALDTRRRLLGNEHPMTLLSINSMVLLLRDLARYDEAAALAEEALATNRRVLGDAHPQTLLAINNIGNVLFKQGKYAAAEPYYREALAGRRRVLGEEHPQTLTSIYNLGLLKQEQGDLQEAERFQREALDVSRRTLGDDHRDTLISISRLGALLRQMGRIEEAGRLGAEAVSTTRRVFPENHIERADALRQYARTLLAKRDFVAAETHALAAAKIYAATVAPGHDRRVDNDQLLIELYDAWHRAEPGRGHDARAAEWRGKQAVATRH